MIEHTLDTANSILYLRPKSALEKDDFAQLAKTVDPHIEKTGDLAGLIMVTDSAMGNVAERLASHFVSAQIRHFPAAELEAAKQWVMNR